MTAMIEAPEIFREGYAKARAVNPAVADAYVTHTMIGDPPADAAVAAMEGLEDHQVNRLIQAGVNREENVLRDAPQELRDLFDTMTEEVDETSSGFFDADLARDGSEGFYKNVDIFMVSLVGLGMVDNLSTLIGKSFLSTGYTTQSSVQRLRQSLRQVMESMLPGGLEVTPEGCGDGWKLTVRARLVHAQARYNLLKSGQWDTSVYGMPVSAAHVAYAVAAFSALTLHGVYKLGVKPTRRQREGYIHIWRHVGWLLGAPDTILMNNEQEGMDLVRIGRICEPPPEVDSIIMAHTILNSGASVLGDDEVLELPRIARSEIKSSEMDEQEKRRRTLARYGYRLCRALMGNELADQLEFPKMRTFGLLPTMRMKRRIDRLLGRASSADRAKNFVLMLRATETDDATRIDYTLPDNRHS